MFIAVVKDGQISSVLKEVTVQLDDMSRRHVKVQVQVAGLLAGVTGLLQGYSPSSQVHLEISMEGDETGMKTSVTCNTVAI